MQGLSFCFCWIGSTDCRYHVGISEHFVIKGTNIYFGYQEKVYVISKQLIVNVFRVCVEGYVEDLKGQVSKIVTIQAL
jgi:hypothetical protein